jgi:hypothetical protein
MQVTVPNFLADAWDACGSFTEAFCDTYESVTLAYDKAAAEGRLPTTHDVVVEEEAACADLRTALLRGDGWLGSTELARQYGCARQHVWRMAKEIGCPLGLHRSAARRLVEQAVRDGVTRPRDILSWLAATHPEVELPTANTISAWKRRM